MFRSYSPLFIGCLSSAILASVVIAGEPNASPEAKLRDTLRNTMLQLRSAEAERDTLKAAQDQNEQDKKALSERLDTVTKQSIADKTAADKKVSDLEASGTKKDEDIAKLSESLEKWKAAYNQVADIARTKEGERAKLAGEKIILERKVADRETKNIELFKLGNEILSRYESFGLGTALSAREPFTRLTKVKLENLVQDYGDKLAEQKVRPDAAPSAAPAPESKPKAAAEKPKADPAAKTKPDQKNKPSAS